MNLLNKNIYKIILAAMLLLPGWLLVSCGGEFRPSTAPAVIEETEGGLEVIEAEFSECEGEEIPDNPLDYVQFRHNSSALPYQYQLSVERQFPHEFDSANHPFPLRGSWRKNKAEILDIVDRRIWSPERGGHVAMLEYFDMVLLINVAARTNTTAENNSAQRMQVLVRNGSSNNLNDWNRIHTWPISSGRPCGQKIETPTGVYKFNPGRIYEEYGSNQFRDENGERINMYETMFLYHKYKNGRQTGVAIHGTYVAEKLGRRDSGGCVRVYRDNMTCLFHTITGKQTERCLNGGQLDYLGKVPSFISENAEADPEFLSSGNIEVNGYRVLIAIMDDAQDTVIP